MAGQLTYVGQFPFRGDIGLVGLSGKLPPYPPDLPVNSYGASAPLKWLSIWALSVILLNDLILSSTLVIILRRRVSDFKKLALSALIIGMLH